MGFTQDEKYDSADDRIIQEVIPTDVIEVANPSENETGSGEEEGD